MSQKHSQDEGEMSQDDQYGGEKSWKHRQARGQKSGSEEGSPSRSENSMTSSDAKEMRGERSPRHHKSGKRRKREKTRKYHRFEEGQISPPKSLKYHSPQKYHQARGGGGNQEKSPSPRQAGGVGGEKQLSIPRFYDDRPESLYSQAQEEWNQLS